MFKVRPWLLVAFLCVLSAAGASGATRKFLEAKYAAMEQLRALVTPRCQQRVLATKGEAALPATEIHAAAAQAMLPTSVVEAAMLALSKSYNEHPHYFEYGGVIVAMGGGKFNASKPETIGHVDNMQIDEDPESYDGGFPIVADYHTHPCIMGYVPGVFSPADLHSMREMNRPGFVLDECTGDVHYWAPGDKYDEPGSPEEVVMGIQLAAGKVVGHIPVDGKQISL